MTILALLGMLATAPADDKPRPSGRPHINECPYKYGIATDVEWEWRRNAKDEKKR